MRNGRKIENPGQYRVLNKYKEETSSKYEFNKDFPKMDLGKHHITPISNGKYARLTGHFPRYFWKGLKSLQTQGIVGNVAGHV